MGFTLIWCLIAVFSLSIESEILRGFYVTEDFEVTQGLVIFKIMKIHYCACLMINATPSQVNIISLLSVKVNFFSLSRNEKICRNFIVKQTYKIKLTENNNGMISLLVLQ